MKACKVNRMRGRIGVAVLVSCGTAAVSAPAAHWSQQGGDGGRSGMQPADQVTLPLLPRWRVAETPSGSAATPPRTSPIITSGRTPEAQRVVYGVETAGDVVTALRLRRLADGASVASVVLDDDAPLDPDNPFFPDTVDQDGFGPQAGGVGVTPMEASDHGTPGQVYVVYNDDNQVNNSDPNPGRSDIAIAQVDSATGTLVYDRSVAGSITPVSPLHGHTIMSAPAMSNDLGNGDRLVAFSAARYDGTSRRIAVLTLPNAAASGAHAPIGVAVSANIANLRPEVAPTIVRMRDPDSGTYVNMVAFATTDGIGTVRASDLTDFGPAIGGLGATSAVSVPVRFDGSSPTPTPFLYAASASGEGTVVRKLKQDESDEFDAQKLKTLIPVDGKSTSPVLGGTPGPQLALDQVIPTTGADAGTAAPGRVLVGTAKNVYSLDTENLAAADPPKVFASDHANGFRRTVPATSGGLGFIADAAGQQYVFRTRPLTPGGPMLVTAGETGFQRHELSLNATQGQGQPAVSRGRVVFGAVNGMYAYGPRVAVTLPAANRAVDGSAVQLEAWVGDASLTNVRFYVDGQLVDTDDVNHDRLSSVTWNSLSVSEGIHAVRAEATDGIAAEYSAPRMIVVNNFLNPIAQLTVSPNPANPGEAVTLDASASRVTTSVDENETIARWVFELDGDGDFDDLVETSAAGGDGRIIQTFPAGTRTVGVRVTDSHGDTAQDTVSLRVNAAPAAALAATPNPAAAGQAVELDASGTTDEDGTIARYEFDVDGDGTYETDTGTDPRVSRAFAHTTEVGVRATDNEGAQSVARVTITIAVTPSGQPPSASFAYAPNPGVAGRPIAFDAAASRDPDGRIVKYEWDFDGDGSFEVSSASAGIVHTYATAGAYRVTLRVTDDGGSAATSTQSVTVAAGCTATTRCAPGIRASVSPRRDRKMPLRFRTAGRLTLPAGVPLASGCQGRVLIQVKRGKLTLSSRRFRVTSSCRFTGRVSYRNRKRLGAARTLRFIVKFQGNKVLTPKTHKTIRVRIR